MLPIFERRNGSDLLFRDGFTSTAKIREVERKRRLPRCTIVALTGVTSSESRESALRTGVDKYFTKPIRMKELLALVAETKHWRG